ncbi:MAG: type II secretion system protein GspC [bacterium]
MIKKSWWIIIFILATTIAYLSADLAALYFRSKLENIFERPIAISKFDPISKKDAVPLNKYGIIENRDLFQISQPVVEEKPIIEPEKPKPEPKPITKLKLKLLGTVVGAYLEPYAIIMDLKKRQQDIYREQDKVGPATVLHIYRNKVIIEHNGKEEMLICFENTLLEDTLKNIPDTKPSADESPPEKAKPARALPSQIGKKIGPDHWELDKSEVENLVDNASQLLTEIRIIPHFKDGKLDNPDGFQLAHVKRGSLFDRMGVKSGDIIQSVNGQAVNSPEKAFEAYQTFKNSSAIELILIRNRKEITLKYDINE